MEESGKKVDYSALNVLKKQRIAEIHTYLNGVIRELEVLKLEIKYKEGGEDIDLYISFKHTFRR